MTLKFSIIINTYNRGAFLKKTLASLLQLRHSDFEVIVVNGPSTDDTETILASYADLIKIGHCPETNLAMSRNIGVGMAAGDIVCFTDDDGIPEPDWLDALEAIYLADERVGAVGGFVRDHTGVAFQARYIMCNRAGDASHHHSVEEATDNQATFPGHYPSLIGVNSSFRKSALAEIGGFDEEYAYFLEETDVCLRLIDAGWSVRITPDAEVHHKFAASHLRNANKIPHSLYYTTRSKAYFGFRNAIHEASRYELFRSAVEIRQRLYMDVKLLRHSRCIDAEHHARLMKDVELGFSDGIRDAHAFPLGRCAQRAHPDAQSFKRFTRPVPAGKRRQLIFITQDYPPRACGGVGVFMHRLAEALAAQGHEISVITRSDNEHTVDLESGVWVHRIPIRHHADRTFPPLPDLPGPVRDHAYSVYDEALRIQSRRGAAITVSAIWDLEAAACVASKAFFDIVYLVTTYQLSLPSKPEWETNRHYRDQHVGKMIAGERWIMEASDQVIASTRGILSDIDAQNPGLLFRRRVPIIPFGLPAAPAAPPPLPAGYPEGPTVLFVGRFELRKGIDVLLEAVPQLLAKHPELHFRLVGDDSLLVDGINLKQAFLARHKDNADILARTSFLGFIDEAQLDAEYANCTIFVAPSRYESFGLIYLEAMRWTKPCIGCDAGGVSDVVDPSSGILVPPGDVMALAGAIDRMLADPGMRRAMGEAGRKRFLENYSVESYAAALLHHLDNTSGSDQTNPQAALKHG